MQLPKEVQELEARSTVHQTPCGEGAIVWHHWGDRESFHPPVVLFHGGSGSWNHWVRNVDALVADGRSVWAADLPGMGASALSPLGTDADALPKPLEQGLEQLLGSTRCDVVGFSFGGIVGGFLAADYPDRMHKLVLCGSPAIALTNQPALNLKQWHTTKEPGLRLPIHRRNLELLMFHDPLAIDEGAVGMQMDNAERDRTRRRRISRTNALRDAIARLQCPLYAIYGAQDALWGEQLGELRAALAGAPRFQWLEMVDRAGHWVLYEQAGAFNTFLLRALNAPYAD